MFGSKASTLTISNSLYKIDPKFEPTVFKCKLKSATYPDFSPEVVNEMTLTILELGEIKKFLLRFSYLLDFRNALFH